MSEQIQVSDATSDEQEFFNELHKMVSKHIIAKKVDSQAMCAMLAQLIGALIAYSSGCAPGETVVKDLVDTNLAYGFDKMTERMEGKRDTASGH